MIDLKRLAEDMDIACIEGRGPTENQKALALVALAEQVKRMADALEKPAETTIEITKQHEQPCVKCGYPATISAEDGPYCRVCWEKIPKPEPESLVGKVGTAPDYGGILRRVEVIAETTDGRLILFGDVGFGNQLFHRDRAEFTPQE